MGAVHEGKKNIQATIYLDLFDQQSCDSNQVGEFKCSDCDDILCQKCFQAHFRLKMLLHQSKKHFVVVHEG